MEQTLSTDTICAVSTPPGRGGIAVVRISGPHAIDSVDSLWRGKPLSQATTHTAHLGTITGLNGQTIDQAVATVFCGPRSYTGDDVVELSVHGSPYIQATLLQALCQAGCRIAEPGEFTRRAFENGRLDLPRAEAVADIIAASSAAAHRLAVSQLSGQFSSRINTLHDSLLTLASLLELELDFSEEDLNFADRSTLRQLASTTLTSVDTLARTFATGNLLTRGIPVAIVGAPNAGKSSLLNQLLDNDRAIVSDIPGTTRDTIEETADIHGLTFRFIDTAGLRQTSDTIETLGIDRALQKAADASIVLWLTATGSTAPSIAETLSHITARLAADTILIPCLTKTDLPGADQTAETLRSQIAAAQATDRQVQKLSIHIPATVDTLKTNLAAQIRERFTDSEGLVVTNARHHQALTHAADSLRRLITGLDTGQYTDLVAQDLRDALHHLSTITGTITTDTILTTIFTRFCIGK